eukprot:2702537-Rhodomonas_salina.2
MAGSDVGRAVWCAGKCCMPLCSKTFWPKPSLRQRPRYPPSKFQHGNARRSSRSVQEVPVSSRLDA